MPTTFLFSWAGYRYPSASITLGFVPAQHPPAPLTPQPSRRNTPQRTNTHTLTKLPQLVFLTIGNSSCLPSSDCFSRAGCGGNLHLVRLTPWASPKTGRKPSPGTRTSGSYGPLSLHLPIATTHHSKQCAGVHRVFGTC